MKCIKPTTEQMQALLQDSGGDGPIVMINLLKFRAQAEYPATAADAEPCTGREAYERYTAVAAKKVAEVGGRMLWIGKVKLSLIAPEGEIWDDAFLVQYPSKHNFLRMVSMPDYQAAAVHRTAALEDSRLIMTIPQGSQTGVLG